MTASAVTVLVASQRNSLRMFLVGFVALFVFSGAGNGSTYKMTPAIFKAKSDLSVSAGADRAQRQRPALGAAPGRC